MNNWQTRTERLLGKAAVEQLNNARVAVFGIGGVGGFAVEALVRGGIGALDIIDHDQVSLSNLNRQIIATTKTIGRDKVDVAEERILEINPLCRVTKHKVFFLPETEDLFDFSQYDYVVDAIDTVKGKLGLIRAATAAGTPVISSMGAGNKLDPTQFEVADIHDTSVDPLARIIRRECRKLGIDKLKVVYSKEQPLTPLPESFPEVSPVISPEVLSENAVPLADLQGSTAPPADAPVTKRPSPADLTKRPSPADLPEHEALATNIPVASRPSPGSLSFVPSVVGLIIAGEVIKDLIR